jgi:hypothetical protein
MDNGIEGSAVQSFLVEGAVEAIGNVIDGDLVVESHIIADEDFGDLSSGSNKRIAPRTKRISAARVSMN